MRNIFDQYSSPENRLTHALGSCLKEDRRLLQAFVKWLSPTNEPKGRHLEIVEQQVPGQPVSLLDEDERGLPDLWIHDGATWSLIIESKVAARVEPGQIHRHIRTAQRNGFRQITLAVMSTSLPVFRVSGVRYLTWSEVYSWMRRTRDSAWATKMSDYMEQAEVRMVADEYLKEGTLTRYDGIPFDKKHPYTYFEAKRVLRLALNELRKRSDLRKLGMDPTGEGRPAITGRESTRVWDFIPLKHARKHNAFTSCPHLTLSIGTQDTMTIITLPNAVSAPMRRRLIGLGVSGFKELVLEVERGISRSVRGMPGAHPHMAVVQRYYPSQRSEPISHAKLEFDLRTAREGARPIRHQPQWLTLAFEVLQKKNSNLQLGIGAILPHGNKSMQSRESLDVIAGVWTACRPWLKRILGG